MRKAKKYIDPIVLKQPLFVEKIAPTGQGIATMNDEAPELAGIKVFLWNALPGEEVSEFKITKLKSHYAEGIAQKITKESPFRITPKDKHFLSTSPWQIIEEAYEPKLKSALLTEMFYPVQKAIQELDNKTFDEIENIHVTESDNNYFYRNKMEYSLYYDKEEDKIKVGAHMRGSHYKIPVETSSIERPELFAKAQSIINELNAKHEEARKYQTLLLRCNQKGEVSGGLYENGKPHPVFDNLKDSLLGQEYSYSPNGFFQINVPVYEKALTRIKELLGDTDKVLDLYSGVGTIGLSVARDKDLTLVEVDKSAYKELENNCKAIENNSAIKPVLAKSEDALEYISSDSVVILDPPRAGCDDKLIEKLLEVHPKKIIYLSCNPATQARDVEKLLRGLITNEDGSMKQVEKYHMKTIEAFNFFPRTPHIESLVSLD